MVRLRHLELLPHRVTLFLPSPRPVEKGWDREQGHDGEDIVSMLSVPALFYR